MNTFIYFLCTHTYLLFIFPYIYLKYSLTLAPEVTAKADLRSANSERECPTTDLRSVLVSTSSRPYKSRKRGRACMLFLFHIFF